MIVHNNPIFVHDNPMFVNDNPVFVHDKQGGQKRERRSTRHALLRHILLVLCLFIILVEEHPKCSLLSLHYVINIIKQSLK